MKEIKKYFSKLGFAFFIGALAVIVAQVGVLGIVGELKPEWMENRNIYMTVACLPIWLIGMPIWILLVKKWVPATKIEQHSMKFGHLLLAAIMSYTVMYISNIMGSLLILPISLLKGSQVGNVGLDIVAGGSNIIVNLLLVVICAPIIEEYVFRKLLIDRTVRYGQGVSILLSGLMFGLYHGNLQQFIYAFGLGAFFAFIYVKTGKLRYTIFLHMFINFMGGVAGVLVLKALDLETYMNAATSGDAALMTQALTENMSSLIAFGLYMILVFAMVITGVVLFAVNQKKIRFAEGEIAIPKGKVFSTAVLNVGMILYSLIWIGFIIYQLCA